MLRSRLLLLAASIVALVVGMELLLRVLAPQGLTYRSPRFEGLGERQAQSSRQPRFADAFTASAIEWVDAPEIYGLRPGLSGRFVSSEFDVSFRTNSSGFRGPALASRANHTNPAAVRILGLGDSFSMGWGVEEDETYLAGLARNWSPSSSGLVEPVNAGVHGYSPYNSYEVLLGRGLALQPELVILQLWVGDDLCGPPQPARPATTQDVGWVDNLKALLRSSRLAVLARESARGIAPLRHWLIRRGMIRPFLLHPQLSSSFEDQCGAALQALSSMLVAADAHVRGSGAHFIVLLVPQREQVYEEDRERALAYNGTLGGPGVLDLNAPNRALRRIAEQTGVELLDATDALRRESGGPRLYFSDLDPHLTARGHAVVAEVLQTGLSPVPAP